MGLAIVKQLVESQGGKINVKSKLDEGSTFSFQLAFQRASETEFTEIATLPSNKENGTIKVLIAEDIALNQLLMKTLLDNFGFERDVTENGKIAIEMLQKNTYDIILMDLQMPEINGLEATDDMGIDPKFETISIKIEQMSEKFEDTTELKSLVKQIVTVCKISCEELQQELQLLNK